MGEAAQEAVFRPERYRHPYCFRLLLDLYARCGIDLPDLLDGADDLETYERNRARFASYFRPAEPPWQAGDVVLFDRNGVLRHVAVVLDAKRAVHAGAVLGVSIQRLRVLLRVAGARIVRYQA